MCIVDEYCPAGWSVKRRPEDYSAHTCNPTNPSRSKCPKPYMCVAAKCGISFCCVSDKMLTKVKQKESEERDAVSSENDLAKQSLMEEEEANKQPKFTENEEDL